MAECKTMYQDGATEGPRALQKGFVLSRAGEGVYEGVYVATPS